MKEYINEAIDEYAEDISFGMPGHKGKDFFDLKINRDLTEFLGTDNLLNPTGAIKNSLEEIARVFGSRYSFYIPNGSSGAINIAVSCLAEKGCKILLQRNCHKSCINSVLINELIPIYIETKYDEESAQFLGIELENLKKTVERERPELCLLVSPNYYGGILNLKEIISYLHKKNIPVIIDEAHGAHLYFSDLKKYSGNFLGADIVINSSHKMIPSLTQTAILHINSEKITRERVLKYINLYTTTSPSYLFIASQEKGISYMEDEGKKSMKILEEEISAWRKKTSFKDFRVKDKSISSYDPMKFLFRLPRKTGSQIVKSFHLAYNIRLEMGDLYYALAIISPKNSIYELKKLFKAIEENSRGEFKEIIKLKFPRPQMEILPSEALKRESLLIDFKNSLGRISAANVSAYPPGIPIVSYGEKITSDVIDSLSYYLANDIEIVGLYDQKIEVVKWVYLLLLKEPMALANPQFAPLSMKNLKKDL